MDKQIQEYVANVDENKRADTLTILHMMQKHTGEKGKVFPSRSLVSEAG